MTADNSSENENSNAGNPASGLEQGTYEILRSRLQGHAQDLQDLVQKLNEKRGEVFGAVPTQLLSTERITTENNCVAGDLCAINDLLIFGYNVQVGLKSEIHLKDVFSVFKLDGTTLTEQNLEFIEDPSFQHDFKQLYKYYKNVKFSRFHNEGPHLYFVFHVGKDGETVKTFKWLVSENKLTYKDNRSDHEVAPPPQHDFQWTRTHRDLHRGGEHPHISIEDRVFVETVGGDLTIKIEDNTTDGVGIYNELVEDADQTLDDAEIFYATIGSLIALKIRPFREDNFRYLVFNENTSDVKRLDAVGQSCVALPEDHGIVFSNGYFLQNGQFKTFDIGISELVYLDTITAVNGEDFLYIFYNRLAREYVLLPYNLITQSVENPIHCHGFCFFPDGRMLMFKDDGSPQKHHALQVWQTPFTQVESTSETQTDSFLYKLGNRDIVRAMSECNEIVHLTRQEDGFNNLYVEIVKRTTGILDSYFWLDKEDAFNVADPLVEIRNVAKTAIEEFDKVQAVRRDTAKKTKEVQEETKKAIKSATTGRFGEIGDFVSSLAALRKVRGSIETLKELKYVDLTLVDTFQKDVEEHTDRLSKKSVKFLLNDDSLKPFEVQVANQRDQIPETSTASAASQLGKEIDQTASELEMLIEIVSNLKIDDATQRTKIIDKISAIYSGLNQSRSLLKNHIKQLAGTEAKAEFHSQLKLMSQTVSNYLDLCNTPAKCEEYLTKMMIQLEELEGRFAEFDEFLGEITEKREEIYGAFEAKKVQIQEARSRRATSLSSAADRILKGIAARASQMKTIDEINSYYAGDLMVQKIRDILVQLEEMEETVLMDEIQNRLKTAKEEAIGQLKDRLELFVDGSNVIQFGKHKFSTNVQKLELTTVLKNEKLWFHLTGTDYFRQIEEDELEVDPKLMQQTLVSESSDIYRAEYLAFAMYQQLRTDDSSLLSFLEKNAEERLASVSAFMAPRYQENYIKGVHDHDGEKILSTLVSSHQSLGDLRFSPVCRVLANLFMLADQWPGANKQQAILQIATDGIIASRYQADSDIESIQTRLGHSIVDFCRQFDSIPLSACPRAIEFLTRQIQSDPGRWIAASPAEKKQPFFVAHPDAIEIAERFLQAQQTETDESSFFGVVSRIKDLSVRFELTSAWVRSFCKQDVGGFADSEDVMIWEAATRCLQVLEDSSVSHPLSSDSEKVQDDDIQVELSGILGNHNQIENGHYQFDFYGFQDRLSEFKESVVPKYLEFHERKHLLLETRRKQLRLNEFQPKVLTSFVRNKLVNDIYLPLIGANLSKQIGSYGDDKRTDLMGLLLLISPPGYGKTTLMEYVANRLGITFMKINGPSIGHQVTSLDPMQAPNASARQEVEKLNLAFQMGDNVMIYLDDIQHCHPEFLQKFISLCDGQRKIEGVVDGEPKTFDLRGKKVCVIMAGNPYTESGDKFQIPDMLSNRADTYNLGDVIGDSAAAFEMSYLENCVTSSSSLAPLQSQSQSDVQTIIHMAEGTAEGRSLDGNYSAVQLDEMVSVMKKLVRVRDVLLKVNALYIYSAAQADEYRTEPAFKLQGSYRDMNKIAQQVVPVMNDKELDTLIFSHFENQAQTLTSDAEGNLLKFKELTGKMSKEDRHRWEEICHTFKKNLTLGAAGDSDDPTTKIIAQLSVFSEGLYEIRSALSKGVDKLVEAENDPNRHHLQNLTLQQVGGAIEVLQGLAENLQGMRAAMDLSAEAEKVAADQPTKIHLTNKVPASFMKIITGQFRVLQTWIEPVLRVAESMGEDGKKVARSAKKIHDHYQSMVEDADAEVKELED